MDDPTTRNASSYVEWIANSEPMVNPDVVEGLTPTYCFYCDGDWEWVPGYDGPIEVPAAERRRREVFTHDDDCVWVVANRMVDTRG